MNARRFHGPAVLARLLRRLGWLALPALLAAGCHLSQEQTERPVLSFDRLYDSLKQYDETVIVLKNQSGDTLDVLFRGKVDDSADLQKLKAPHWDGGMVVVSITGIQAGVAVSQVETLFDPSDSSHDQVVVVVTQEAALSSPVKTLTLLVGDSVPLPVITVNPANLQDKALDWQAGPPEVLALGQGHLKTLQAGAGILTASLRKQPSVTLTIAVTVGTSDQVPESLAVEPDSLEVPEDGAPKLLTAKVFPGAASQSVQWSSEDTAVATVDAAGRVSGKGRGVTRIWAASAVRPSVKASARVKVTGDTGVDIDTTGPAAPRIVGTSPTSSLPRWTWSSGGNGGAGVYRSRLGDAAFPADAPESRDSAFALTAATSGNTYTLYVQERDAAGNWSAAASLAIKYDLTRPTVAITVPQASGTFITSKDTVSFKGTATGPNGIATLEYSMNGGAANPITIGAGGSWSLNALTVPNAKITVIKVIAADSLGNTGEAEISILRDSDPPTPPTSLSVPASPTNVKTITWTWAEGEDGTAGSGLSGRYRWRLGTTGTWTEVTTPTAAGVTLAEGANTFQVQEQDRAGNWSASASSNVVLDTRAPDAVTFVGIDSSYTASATPAWSWTPSTTNGGIAEYVLKLDNGAEFAWTTTTFTPTTALSDTAAHTLTVRQRDQVPGVLGAAKSFTYRVKVNPPAAPAVRSLAGTTANLATNNPGFSWTSGGGGNGNYRVFVNAEAAPRVTGIIQTTWSLPANAADGAYTIRVQEQDALGRWSAEGSFSITLDRTGPQYTNVRISGKSWNLRDGFITNQASLVIGYQADGTAKSFTCNLTRNNASNPCTTSNVDALGNKTTLSRNIWRRSNVVFFTVAGAGTKDGSSWEDAASDIQAEIDRAGSEGKEFWLATGTYPEGIMVWDPKWLYMHGGFQAANFPVDTVGRVRTGTIIPGLSMMGGNPGGAFSRVVFSGGVGLGGGTATSPLYFDDVTFKGHVQSVFLVYNHMRNCEISGVTGGPALNVSSSASVIWEGGKITGNSPGSGNYLITNSGNSLTFRGTVDMSANSTSQTAILENWSSLRISGTVRVTTTSNLTCNSAFITAQSGSTCGN